MKKLFKKFIVLCIAIGGIFLASNKCFAENYKVRIIVLGNREVGKTSIVRILDGNSIFREHIATIWEDKNASRGFRIVRNVNGDTYECYFYDAPGYINRPDSTLNQQIEQVNLRNMSLAIMVIDYKDSNFDHGYGNPVNEAIGKHIYNLKHKNSDCMVFLVVNKSDLLTPDDLSEVNRKLEAAATCHGTDFSDSVVISAREGTNFDIFENMIDRFLSENTERFQNIRNSFFTCQNRNCREEYFYDGDDPSNNPGYCGKLECKRQVEGTACANDKTDTDKKCPRNRPKLLPEDEDVYRSFNDESRNLYCSSSCRLEVEGKIKCCRTACINHNIKIPPNQISHTIEKNGETYWYCDDTCYRMCNGTQCANDNTYDWNKCPNDRPYVLPNEGIESWRNNNRYCCEECRGKAEGKKCAYDGIYHASSVPGVYGWSNKWYCSDAHKKAAGDTCSIM